MNSILILSPPSFSTGLDLSGPPLRRRPREPEPVRGDPADPSPDGQAQPPPDGRRAGEPATAAARAHPHRRALRLLHREAHRVDQQVLVRTSSAVKEGRRLVNVVVGERRKKKEDEADVGNPVE